jgi:hypothetical protein
MGKVRKLRKDVRTVYYEYRVRKVPDPNYAVHQYCRQISPNELQKSVSQKWNSKIVKRRLCDDEYFLESDESFGRKFYIKNHKIVQIKNKKDVAKYESFLETNTSIEKQIEELQKKMSENNKKMDKVGEDVTQLV